MSAVVAKCGNRLSLTTAPPIRPDPWELLRALSFPTPEHSVHPLIHNRIRAVMMHTARYAFKSQARLAQDTGVSPSAISRLLSGQSHPTYVLAIRVTQALEKSLGRWIDPRELISFDGRYPTASVCRLCGCKGCLPDTVYDENSAIRPEYRDIQPGHWQPTLTWLPDGSRVETVRSEPGYADSS